jgi:hypothetical protein
MDSKSSKIGGMQDHTDQSTDASNLTVQYRLRKLLLKLGRSGGFPKEEGPIGSK